MTEERALYIADTALTKLLRDLRAAANDILTTSQNRNPPKGEPVDWTALYCHSAGIMQDYRDCREGMGYIVMVESAAPDAAVFGDWLTEQLAMAGWPNVEVVTEW